MIDDLTIGVVIPYYNGQKYWSDLVVSLQSQSSKLDEAVIVLDGPDQILPDISLDGIAQKVKILQLETNHGVAGARNRGLLEIGAEYVFFLDQDDYFLENRVEMVRYAIREYMPAFVLNTVRAVDSSGTKIREYRPGDWISDKDKIKRANKQYLFASGSARISGVCCKKSISGFFDETVGSCDDYVFLMRLVASYPGYVLDVVGNARRFHSANQSQTKRHRASKIRAVSFVGRRYAISKASRRLALVHLCNDMGIDYMICKDKYHAVKYFRKSLKIKYLNPKAIICLFLYGFTDRPDMIINRGKRLVNFFNKDKSHKIIGSSE